MPIVKSTSEILGKEVPIYIEVEEVPKVVVLEEDEDEDEETRGNIADKIAETVEDVGDLFGQGINLARSCAVEAIQNFEKMHHNVKPDEVELQLAIKLGAKVGAVIAKTVGEAQINVTMKWKLKDNSQQVVS